MCVAGITFFNFSGTKEVMVTLTIGMCLMRETAFCAAVMKHMSYEEKCLL
jgi:hypothetical protein